MCTLASLAELVLSAAYHHLVAMLHKGREQLLEREQLGTAVDKGDIVDRKRRLHLGHLEELVEHHRRVCVGAQLDDDTHTVGITLVVDVGDAVEALLGDELSDILDELGLVYAVGNLIDHDGLVVGLLLDGGAGAYHHPAAAGGVILLHAAVVVDSAAGGEVGGGDYLDELVDGDVGILEHGD